VRWQLVAMKALLGVFDLLVLGALILLLSALRQHPGLCVLYAWCPLVLKELANSGHMDAIPAFFVLLALWAQVRLRGVAYGFSLALAVAAKIYAVLLLPLGLRSLGFRRGGLAVACFVAVVLLSSLLVAGGDSRRPVTLVDFALHWEMHDAFFSWVKALWGAAQGPQDVSFELAGAFFTVETAHLLALLTALAALCAVVLSSLWSLGPTSSPRQAPRAAFAVLVALFLLGPLGFPWYFVWCVPLLPFVRLRAWLCLPGLLSMYYLRFWFDYQYPQGYGGFSRGVDFFDVVIVSLEFSLLYLILCLEICCEKIRGSGRRDIPASGA
jgi:hypothetical protein